MRRCIAVFSLGLGIISSFSAYANNNNYKDGLVFGSKNDPYWFAVNGALQLDERLFFGNKRGNLHSGASLRKFDVDLSGGLGKDLSFTAGVGFDAHKSKVDVNDAYVTYSGYKGFGDNFDISVGKVNPSFCLEATSSSKWTSFMERSLPVIAFRPDSGFGVSINKWQNDYSLNATINVPSPNDKTEDENGKEISKSDRLQFNARATKAHFFGENKFLQAGLSGHVKEDGHTGVEFSTGPEAKSRHSSSMLLNTTNSSTNVNLGNNKKIKANRHYAIGLELTGQDGPLSGQGEYIVNLVNRDKGQPGAVGNLKFPGYYAIVNYVLTGESRKFKANTGTLGQVIPSNSECGAWEVSGRYSFLNLNDKDIVGGADHSIGAALTWYANNNLSVVGEYMKHYVKRSKTLEKLHIDTIGARLQFVF